MCAIFRRKYLMQKWKYFLNIREVLEFRVCNVKQMRDGNACGRLLRVRTHVSLTHATQPHAFGNFVFVRNAYHGWPESTCWLLATRLFSATDRSVSRLIETASIRQSLLNDVLSFLRNSHRESLEVPLCILNTLGRRIYMDLLLH